MLRITSVEPLDGYRLRLTFNDGAVTEADFSDDLRGPLGEPLRDPAYFRRLDAAPSQAANRPRAGRSRAVRRTPAIG